MIAVIGAGSIGTRHANNLKDLGVTVELIGWRGFDSVAFECRTDIEAVVIATSTPIRLELIELCAANGWPFYAEKPLAWRVDQAHAIHDAGAPVADRSMVGYMMRYHPAVKALAAHDLSEVYSFSFEIGHDVRQWRQNWSFAGSYAAEPEGGGVLMDLCHEIDLAQAIMGELQLSGVRSMAHELFPDIDFATRLDVSAKSGAVGSVAMDYVSPVSIRRAALRSTDKIIDLDFLVPSITLDSGAGADVLSFNFERNDMFVEIMRDFLALVRGATPSSNPLIPRFDRMRESSVLIASAWEQRQISGHVDMDMS